MSGIYIIKNIVNGKYYVGSSININNRIKTHKKRLNNKSHHSIKLQRAWNKYGADSFIFEPIQYCEKENLITNEQYWIDNFDSYNNGYNSNPIAGSSLGRKLSKEHKEKISYSLLGNKRRKGFKQTEEEKIKRANSNIGKKRSEETKKKLSISKIGNKYSLGRKMSEYNKQKLINANKGRKMSEETKLKISESKKGKTPWNKGLKLKK